MSSKMDGTVGEAKSTRLDFVRSAPASALDTGSVDEPFARSVAALSAQLAARFAKDGPFPEETQPEYHQAAPTKPASRGRSPTLAPTLALTLALALCFAAVVVAGGTYLFGRTSPSPSPASPSMIAAALPPPPSAVVDPAPAFGMATPAPAIVEPPPPAAVPPAMKEATPKAAPAPAPAPQPIAAAPDMAPASLYDILEVQARLRSLGLNPGPLDGVAGPQTVMAAKRYQESRGQPQTGTVDRELLGQLRQDTDRPGPPRRTARP